MLLKSIEIHPANKSEYPLNLPIFATPLTLSLDKEVTLLVGDNGSGKSTLLRLIQNELQLVEIKKRPRDKQLGIEKNVTLSYQRSKPKGFYFESVDFITYLHFVNEEKEAARAEIARIEDEYKDKSEYSKMMAKSAHQRTIAELDGMYQKDLSKSSHGESYLDFFVSRIRPNQLYILDEPETPLSFQNQLTLMLVIQNAVKNGCQFLIATHSPVLMAMENATIYEILRDKIVATTYDNIESIRSLRQFIRNPESFLRYLREE